MNRRRIKKSTAVAVGCLLALAGNAAMAADVGGTVKGRVTKEAGAAVAGATITLTHKEKNITRTTQANADGEYILRNLPVGDYTATIGGTGYNTTKQDALAVLVGSPVVLDVALQPGQSIEEVVVTGVSVSRVDMAASSAGMSFDSERLDLLPVANGFEQMALLTPGAVETGGSNFNGASSISGGSSAENGYYLNGINVTQIQSGLGAFRLPWEAIAQTNVQTGGVTAEFGGALGGIVNSVTKTGSNEFKFGSEYRNDLRETYSHHDSVRMNTDTNAYWINNRRDENSVTESNFWASGPILRDRVFFYALYNPIVERYSGAGDQQDGLDNTFSTNTRESDRWLATLEGYITPSHSVKLTGFSTKRERTRKNYDYDPADNTLGEFAGKSMFEDGGYFYGASYHGEFGPTLALDIVAGRTQEEEVPRPGNRLPLVQDNRTGSPVTYSSHTDSGISPQEFVRDQLRADLTWDLDDHSLKAGVDTYKINVDVDTRQNGIVIGDPLAVDDAAAFGAWEFRTRTAGDSIANEAGISLADLPLGANYVRRRVRVRFADSEVTSRAFYLQDSWQVTDDVTLDLGVRNTSFENTVSSGEAYLDLDNNIEPRFGAVWDVLGDGRTKAYVSAGRYFQPVAARMNIVQGSSSTEYFDFYAPASLDSQGRAALLPDGSPDRGARLGSRVYRQRGITDPGLIASKNIEAMYSDQFAVGFEMDLTERLRGGVRVTYNELGRSVEDTDYGPVLETKLAELGIANNVGQSGFYILSNPGKDVQIAYDFDGDGDVDPVTLTSAETQLPDPERKYAAVLLTLSGNLTDALSFDASYTWSHSYGNTEGLVKTDNDQADPGWTTSYDYGDLMDHAYGNLPNDHRHAVRLSGLYDISEYFSAGFVFRATSGAPKSVFALHPDGVDGCAAGSPWAACASQGYDEVSHYNDQGEVVPRGSAGRLPWVTSLDLSLTFRLQDFLGGAFSLKGTVYNVFDQDKPLAINQVDVAGQDDYGLTSIYQGPRYFSLIGRVDF